MEHEFPVVTERSEESVHNIYFKTSGRFFDDGVRVYTELVYLDGSKSGWMYNESTRGGYVEALAVGRRLWDELYYRLVANPHFLLRKN